ncbi:hypothetical protein BU23DRAFT_312824 [Bimuria novae-zelandiae CBS 107.79]|uniref:Uncharacterized protein n=1 Tax=Bimuria novae-zelandiae CBS 107.79 TaxID=1447943 RepID=A0A6A5URV7_9PLEO|nr:hypothetical protein BU23DRAFT_312824 [Bimuria novae-zelandiae CBS 107.79]
MRSVVLREMRVVHSFHVCLYSSLGGVVLRGGALASVGSRGGGVALETLRVREEEGEGRRLGLVDLFYLLEVGDDAITLFRCGGEGFGFLQDTGLQRFFCGCLFGGLSRGAFPRPPSIGEAYPRIPRTCPRTAAYP